MAALVFCGVGAWLLTLVKWNRSMQELLPFVFLAVVLVLGMIFGRAVGVFGSIIAATVFAHSLYAPVGSVRVADQSARSGLAWMLLAGVSLSFLLLPAGRGSSGTKHSS